MNSTILESAGTVGVAAYLYLWRIGLYRSHTTSLESLLARLRPGWNARELTGLNASDGEADSESGDYWKKLWNAHGLWAMYSNAGVMLEIVNCASLHCSSADPELLAALRRDAMEIRINVLKTAVRYACGAMRESVCMSALRAESAYAEMMAGVLVLLEQNAKDAVPAFVAAI